MMWLSKNHLARCEHTPGSRGLKSFAHCKIRINPACVHDGLNGGSARSSAFTLIEVLATMLVIGIAIPSIMRGLSVSSTAGENARRTTEAAGLAESKLSEILATGQWQGGVMSGNFGSDWPAYSWKATIGNWAQDTSSASVQQIDLTVYWTARSKQNSFTISTLTYVRPVPQSSS
jgi:general secretion pathway protein I